MTQVADFEFILALLLAVLVLALAARRLHLPPAAAFILGGTALAVIPGVPVLTIEPDLVIVLFLPPLLMGGAYFIVWREFRANLSGILLLAVGAVAFTTLAVGVAAHWLLPGLPWAVCFALGAIVSPPDAVAAEAILERLNLPERITTLLQGESLLNDATGLVLFRMAVVAALTGSFSVGGAVISFCTLSIGGTLAGVAVGLVGVAVLRRLADVRLGIAASLLLPWGSYIGGEAIGVSGVLATVACGMTLGWHQHTAFSANTRLRASAFWGVFTFLLESLVFILIGLSLHGVLVRVSDYDQGIESLLAVVGVIILTTILSRFVWVFGSDLGRRVLRLVGLGRGFPPSFAAATVMSWAGMRGVVSMAAALSLPEALPGRDFVLAATFGVILMTVLVQGTTLGLLIRLLRLGGSMELDSRYLPGELAWSRMAQVQFAVVQSLSHQPDGTERHPRLVEQYGYRARISVSYAEDPVGHRPLAMAHFGAVLRVIDAGRQEVLRMHRAGEIHDRVLSMLEHELDLQQMSAEHLNP